MLNSNETPLTDEDFSKRPSSNETFLLKDVLKMDVFIKDDSFMTNLTDDAERNKANFLLIGAFIGIGATTPTEAELTGEYWADLPAGMLDQPYLSADADADADADEANIANNDRMALLARKYARKYANKKLSCEDAARLEILSERVKQLIPRVTEKDFQNLENILSELNEISSADDKLRKELGIDE